jgi:serine/threonine protein kinase
VYDEESYVVLVIENLLESLSQKIANGAMFENKARRCIYNLIHAVKYIHEQKLLHRNICLESLVIGQGMYWYDSVKLFSFESAVEGERVQATVSQ